MAKNLEFRKFRRGDEEGLSSLFREIFHVEKNADYWNWKYFQNPAGQHMIIVALDKDKIVGATGTIPVRFKVGSNEIIASQAIDLVLLPQYRGRRTFFTIEKIARKECIDNNVKFNYGFTIKKTYRIATKFLGFEGVYPISNMTKVLNPSPYLRQKIRVGLLASPLGYVAKQVLNAFNRRKLSAFPGLTTGKISRFDSRFDDLWSKEADHYEVAVIRDSQYLNWRYVECPALYKIYSARENGSIKGFIVLGCFQEDIKRGRIVDIFVEKGRKDIADVLIARGINYFIEECIDVITCWMLEQWPIIESLIKRGFVKRETHHDFVVRSYTDEFPNEYFADKSKWYLTMGDSDYY
ncbi:MAG: GNAT family N-acetyltransferase [Desulfobacteraceae bacterium]|nr:GNAT family N-acetyltransferase [Desulfobacteraceae bacterium]MBC2720476.1 GNAT family N-acetyltransferase [Desulfobacteraceae bacterium]